VRKRTADNGALQGPDQMIRADARRNYGALVEAAVAVFAASGVDAPMKAIADRAGVGVGTVYRRFPKRSDLIVAVFRHEVDSCADAAGRLVADREPFEALSRWIERYVDLIVTKRGLATALHSDDPAYESLSAYFEDRLVPPLQRLLRAAGHEIRADMSAAELLRAVALLCAPAASGDFAQTRRMVTVLLNGLRVPSPQGAMRPKA
jgi:AcrR family transcriptional regulator